MPEFLAGIRDAVVQHQRLHVEKRILHGDISDVHIVLTNNTEDDKSRGMLIDLGRSATLEQNLAAEND
ncbi:BgTH12-04248 [Blumeria graminis f. sp. triticale]|uniref:Bgt-51010 n=2 Tax=Blumeria graminis TaxID=34373 RepID=A0A9X9L9N7_BLUGR|nr:BgTH12-04248 [Blumeria graminis f. sp. triticale]VCU40376.1 Bgt-51010 [Blumeria graminis f. sp. tritici]